MSCEEEKQGAHPARSCCLVDVKLQEVIYKQCTIRTAPISGGALSHQCVLASRHFRVMMLFSAMTLVHLFTVYACLCC